MKRGKERERIEKNNIENQQKQNKKQINSTEEVDAYGGEWK